MRKPKVPRSASSTPIKGWVGGTAHRCVQFLLIVFSLTFRLGEAAQPGPTPGVVLGTMNPTGLMGKGADIGCLPRGIWATQETHLTVPGIRQFKQELAWHSPGYHVCHGAPAPPKTPGLRTIGGKHTGVAFLSAYPIRSVPHHWSPEEFSSGRCQTASALVQQRWITMGTVYGFAEKCQTIEVQQQTNQLLAGLTSRVVDGSTGLRMVAGDWNVDRPHLQQADVWEAQGWIEAQQLALQKWNRPLQCTCKKTSIKDYLFLSPELIPYVEDVQLDWSIFADHAVLKVYLSALDQPPKVPIWRKPSVIPWPDQPDHQPWMHSQTSPDVDQWYQNICQNLERYASTTIQAQGQPPLSEQQKGRAATREVRWVTLTEAPVKPNRQGDIQSTLTGTCLQHTRWTRQIRRLQHYMRSVAQPPETSSKMEHIANLWHKITHASGFTGTFSQWWASQDHQFATTPMFLPQQPPIHDTAVAIFTEFQAHYRQLESQLNAAKQTHAKQRRAKDPMQIYRDLHKERAEPVQTLVTTTHVCIAQQEPVDDHQVRITLQQPIPPGMFSFAPADIPMSCKLESDTQLLIAPEAAATIGSTMPIKHIVGDIPTITKMFEDEWSPRWQRHQDTKDEHWQPILDFIHHALPCKTVSFPRIDIATWRQAVRKKKTWAAIGPDGLSKADLVHAPDEVTQDLLDVIQGVEEGMPWPNQALTGIIAALAKVPTAQAVGQYRPITILSMFYRVWSSIRAKQCIAFLFSLVPESVLGNIPFRSPRHLWYHVQELIEHSYVTGSPVAGSVIDIVKCFNMLPRKPIEAMALAMGIPPGIVKAWHQGLRQLSRRFQVRGSLGSAVMSTCGYPEGCALSVVAMLLCNITCQLWITAKYPRLQVWSFVDNIETIASSAEEADESLTALQAFCSLLELPVDPTKTYSWTTTTEGRNALRQAGHQVQYYARDLGGHMNYSRLKTNKTVKDKMEQLKPIWPRLSRSPAPLLQKERALYVTAWPNVFYGISTVTVGQSHFTKLRTLATRAMQVHQHGANPQLQLSCVSDPRADPEFYSILHTLIAFRAHHTADLTSTTMQHLLTGGSTSQGPCNSLLHVLSKLMWTWQQAGWCLDHHGIPIQLATCSLTEFTHRVTQAWQFATMAHVETIRPTMQGAKDTDVQLTLRCLKSFNPEKQAFLRCALNGTQYTHDALFHTGKVASRQCKFCDHEADSVQHRTWECPFFQDLRIQHDAQTWLPPDPPKSLTHHGWLPASPHQQGFRKALLTIPDRTAEFHIQPNQVEHGQDFDLFLDGSCLCPTQPSHRVATWGLVWWDQTTFRNVANGGVPGWSQTSLRGEITAAIAALKFMVTFQQRARLWIDNMTVFNMLTAWHQGQTPRWQNRKDADLWYYLARQFDHAKPLVLAVLKVKAHAKPSAQTCPVEEWAVQGNIQADKSACQARDTLPPAVWEQWKHLVSDNARTTELGRRLHALLSDIGARAVNTTLTAADTQPMGIRQVSDLQWDPGLLHLLTLQPADTPSHFQIQETQHILDWLRMLHNTAAPTQWVTFHQLLLSYQKHTGRFGPTSTGKQWIDIHVPWHGYDHKQQAYWMSQFLTNLARACKHPLKLEQRRPASCVLAFWCGAIRIGVPQRVLHEIDDHFVQYSLVLPARQVKHLQNVLPAT